MRVDFVTCDVFTDRPFAGNPLLVVPDARGLSAAQMQSIAREINYSESTFVLPADEASHAYRQRTFVPVKEIPYAGHPTVGTALVLSWLGAIAPPEGGSGTRPVTIEVGFGPLGLDVSFEKSHATRVRMAQGKPEWGAPVTEAGLLSRLSEGLRVPVGALGGGLPLRSVSTGNRFLIVPVADVAALSGADADPRLLVALEEELGVLGTYLFAFAPGGQVRARAFCPGAGVPEDPATGSAAGPLGVYLALERALPGGSARFSIDQGIEMGRPSVLGVEVATAADGTPAGVRVEGSAVRMMSGWLEV